MGREEVKGVVEVLGDRLLIGKCSRGSIWRKEKVISYWAATPQVLGFASKRWVPPRVGTCRTSVSGNWTAFLEKLWQVCETLAN